MAKAPSPRPAVNVSALHVFQILRLITKAEEPLGVAEIARRIGLPTSTVHRALVTLEEGDYIGRHQNAPRYELGLMPQYLARALFQRFPLRNASLPFLQQIADASGETTSLCVRVGWRQMRIAVIHGVRDLYSPDRLGEIGLLHRGPASKAILAFLPDRQIQLYVRRAAELDARSREEIEGRRLREDIRLARERRFVADDGAIGLPLLGPGGEAIASVLVSGPAARNLGGAADRPAWAAAVDDLQALLQREPQLCEHPYAHLDPDAVVLDP